jgi:hypothetical protein
MRISYQCPAHLKFGLNITAWSKLVDTSREAIIWLDSHDRFFDTWFLVAYSLVSCALVQVSTEAEFAPVNMNSNAHCFSTTPGRGDRTQMQRTPCGCYETVSNDGNRHKRTEKSLPDGRLTRFSCPTSCPHVADLVFSCRRLRF